MARLNEKGIEMSSKWKGKIDAVIDREGGYVDHPADRGGPTKFGITHVTARAYGYGGDMRDLPRDVAFAIYERQYLTDPKIDQVAERLPLTGEAVFDWGVNSWHSHPIKALQRALNVLVPNNPAGKPDGIIGPATLRALDAYKTARGAAGDAVLADMINGQRHVFLMEIAERNPSQRAFSYGWARRVAELG
ncbi:hypothetical protein Axy19_036 [Achromobacter phage vB_AxyS_19-32_Axy19]|nr:hypothetical protein Axy19_036 [Achromobacter phage vB_AxyS_19-32_Axy19]